MDASTRRRLDEISAIARGGTALDAIAAAVAVEDAFAIVLDDADMTPDRLGSAEALAATVERYLGRS